MTVVDSSVVDSSAEIFAIVECGIQWISCHMMKYHPSTTMDEIIDYLESHLRLLPNEMLDIAYDSIIELLYNDIVFINKTRKRGIQFMLIDKIKELKSEPSRDQSLGLGSIYQFVSESLWSIVACFASDRGWDFNDMIDVIHKFTQLVSKVHVDYGRFAKVQVDTHIQYLIDNNYLAPCMEEFHSRMNALVDPIEA